MTDSPGHFRRRRPPWWPEGEPWPPSGSFSGRAWRRPSARFFWRVGLIFALVFTLSVCATSLFISLVAGALGVNQQFPAPPVAVLLVVLVIFLLTGRAVRRMALPLGDVMEKAGRVADGDYAARVVERGPREVRALARAFNSMAARLQANEQERRNLLAEVTHDLRTPLTVIQGNLEGLVDGVYPRDDAHLIFILQETRVLSRRVDDLRTLALAESGALVLQKEPTDVAMLARETVASFRDQADTAGVGFEIDMQPETNLAEVDPSRVRQVLENLIVNSLRYTPAGGHIRVRCVQAGSGSPLELSVADTGAGISPDDLPHIFERFFKSDDSRGTGLGLAIAKKLVQAHGGEMTAESEPGQGTTIHFTLPAMPAG